MADKFLGLGLTAWVALGLISILLVMTGIAQMVFYRFTGIQLATSAAIVSQPAGAGGPITTGPLSGTKCQDTTTGTSTFNLRAQTVNYTNKNNINGIATPISVFRSGEQVPLVSTTTNASGELSVAQIQCGQALTAFVGDGGTSSGYNTQVDVSSAETQLAQVPKYASILFPSNVSSISFKNATGVFQTEPIVVANAGAASSNRAVVEVQAGNFAYGDGAFEVCMQVPQTNISSVNLIAQTPGFTVTQVANDPAVAVQTGKLMTCYEVGGTQMVNSNIVDLNVIAYFTGPVSGANVTLSLNDRSSVLKNGAYLPGEVLNGKVTNGRYVDENNNDLGQPVITIANAISYQS